MTNISRLAKSDYLKLMPILALAFYMAFIPHQNYPYLVHLDEWMHLAASNAMLKAGSVTFINPYSGQSTISLSSNLEAGFQLFWAVFHQISGLSWLTIFKFFPGIVFMMTVLSVFTLARREGFGWEAAMFACLIPTTIGLLGPGFLVPAAMGLLMIPLAILVAYNFNNFGGYAVLFIFTGFLLSLHAPTAVILVIVLAPYIILNFISNLRHSLGITLAVIVPFLVVQPWLFSYMLEMAIKPLFGQQPPLEFVILPSFIQIYGFLPILLCLMGAFMLVTRGDKRNYGLVMGLLALLTMLVTFFVFHFGIIYLYYRGWMVMMLLVSVIAGAGMTVLKNLNFPAILGDNLKVRFIKENMGKLLCLIVIGLIFAIAIPDRQDTKYYYMIDDEDYQAFIWINENIGTKYEKALLDPWKGSAFTAITGKSVFTFIGEYPKKSDLEAYDFLAADCQDTEFLKENEISIVYTKEECNNPNLLEVREYIYLLK